MRIQTLDAVRYLWSLRARTVALKLDVEGSEFTMLRDLLLSGALCARVDQLWVEWHGNRRIDWEALGLPLKESDVVGVFGWMLRTAGDAKQISAPQDLGPHCRTVLGAGWA